MSSDAIRRTPVDESLSPTTYPTTQAEVNKKIGRVYLYTAAAFATSFISAHLFSLSGLAGKMITLIIGTNALAVGIGLLAVGIGLLTAVYLTPKENSGLKHTLFGLFTVYEGLFLSPLVILNAPAFAAAAITTAGITGGLGILALKMQTQFKRFEKIMFVALLVITTATFGSLLLPGVAGAFAHQLSLVGGLALFSAYVIYHTQQIRDHAQHDNGNFDEINHSINLYLDAMNIFIRIYEIYDRFKK
ncbi:MAG: growth hormone-inducible transrane protein-like [Parachlamydiales bacterium]|nr:growth hormone-inducible transrane protein-like [Parachlamydiales bacterium]